MKTFYITVVSDKHSDDSLEPFWGRDEAIRRAEEATASMVQHYHVSAEDLDTDLNSDMQRDGWIYYAALEDAGHVRVETKELP